MDFFRDEVELHLWGAYLRENSVPYRNRLFHYYAPWLKKIVAGFYLKKKNPLLQWSDCMQNAAVALIETIENYDVSKRVPFEGYAYIRIKGALLNAYNKESTSVANLESSVVDSSPLDISENIDDMDFDAFVDSVISVAFSQLLDISAQRISEVSANPLDLQILYCEERMVVDAVDKLDENLRFIIMAHYQHYMSFKSIAETMDLSKSRISQLHAVALHRLRVLYEDK